jgi:hypothetical protein
MDELVAPSAKPIAPIVIFASSQYGAHCHDGESSGVFKRKRRLHNRHLEILGRTRKVKDKNVINVALACAKVQCCSRMTASDHIMPYVAV